MKKQVDGLIRLSRFKEYIFFVTVTTFLGAASAQAHFGWPLVSVLVANGLAVAFAFMINDVEDAPEDALNPKKVNRNPVSAGDIHPNKARIASFVTAFLAVVIFASLGIRTFSLGLLSLVLGFLYSWRRLRLKNLPFLDFLSHVMMLAGLQFLCAYFTFSNRFAGNWWIPFIFVVGISLYGELFNELRDFEGDSRAGLKHTAVFLGSRITHWLMMVVFSISVIAGIFTFFVAGITPLWVVILMLILAIVFVLPPIIKIRRSHSSLEIQEPLQKPLEIACAFSLLMQFVVPWVSGNLFGT